VCVRIRVELKQHLIKAAKAKKITLSKLLETLVCTAAEMKGIA
jgi:hypothetical protein